MALHGKPNFYIDEKTYNDLVGPRFWTVNEVPPERYAQVRNFLAADDTLAVFASGNIPVDRSGEIAGFDRARIERNPKQGEPDINVYHYGIGKPVKGLYPVYGPIKDKSIVRHWPQSLDEFAAYERTTLRCPWCHSTYSAQIHNAGEVCGNQAMTGANPAECSPTHPCQGRLEFI